MSISVNRAALALSFFTLSTVAVAGDPGPGGVPVDISNIVLYPQKAVAAVPKNAAGTTVAKSVQTSAGSAVGNLQTGASKAATNAAAGDTLAAAGATATETIGVMFDKSKGIASNIIEAMTPSETIAPLSNDRFELYLSDKVIFGQFERTAADRFKLDEARMHLGLLYSEERDTVFQAGLSADSSLTGVFRLSFGGRGYVGLLGDENEDTVAAALGVEAAYQLPFKRLPLEFGASIYYAPDILTFGSSDRVIDTRFGVTLPVRSQLSVFTGARFLQFDTRPGDEEVDNRVHLGVRWDFKDSGA